MMRWLVVAPLLFGSIASCSSREKNNKEKTAPAVKSNETPKPAAKKGDDMSKCTDRIRSLVMEGQLGEPLMTGCSRADVVAVLGKPESSGEGRLSGKPRAWLKYSGPADGGKTRVWLDGDTVLMFVVHKPRIKGDVAALLGGLGKPEDDLDSRTKDYDHFVRDQVFASKGMTLTVGKPHRGDGGPVIMVAFYYAPTTAADYIGKLGGKDPWVRKFRRR